jgi:hypothetical protein
MSYHTIAALLNEIIRIANNLQLGGLLYNAWKNDQGSAKSDIKVVESLGTIVDVFSGLRNMFTQFVIEGDLFVENFAIDNFLKRFLSTRDKVQNELDKKKPDMPYLATLLSQLKLHLDALQNYGKPSSSEKPESRIQQSEIPDVIILEKGKPAQALADIERIFHNAKSCVKIMDKWVSDKTLEFLFSSSQIPIRILTSVIEEKSAARFYTLYRRMREERGENIEVRKCSPQEFHDRYIITGDELWMLGPSLKDASYKNWGTITRIKDEARRKEIEDTFDAIWKRSLLLDIS